MHGEGLVHEFVFFGFRAGVPVEAQRAHMAQIERFARARPGFVARECFYTPESGRWIDHVVWHDRDSALAAADALPRDADLSAVLKAIDETSVSFGHYVAEGATAR
jgi:hypothetical protein